MDRVKSIWATISLAYQDAIPTPRIVTIAVLLIVLVISIVLIWGIGFSEVPAEPAPIYYLLSTQAQVLATILALVLTLSLVAGQLATRYAHRAMTQVFGWWWVPYFGLYILGTAVPLLLLMGNFRITGVRLSLMLAVLCLALIAPYFVALKRRLTMDFIIGRLEKTAISGYGAKPSYATPENADSAVRILDNMSMGAFQAHDIDSFDLAVGAMSSVAKNIASQQISNKASDPALDISNRLGNIGLRVLDDPSAPSLVIAALGDLGRAGASQRASLSPTVCEILKNLGESAASKNKEQVVSSTIHSLRSIGMELIDSGAEDTYVNLVYFCLRILCIDASRQKLGAPAFHTAIELGQLGSKSSEHGRGESVHQALIELDSMASILLDNGLHALIRNIAFAAGAIGKSCINHASDYPNLRAVACQAANTLWTWASRSRLYWNKDVNSAFTQNLEELAILPGAKSIVDGSYSSVRGVFQESTTDNRLEVFLEEVKREYDARMGNYKNS